MGEPPPQRDNRVFVDSSDTDRQNRTGLVALVAVVAIGAFLFLGSVGTPFTAPSDDIPEVTAPPQQPLAIMPDLSGLDLIDVVTVLRANGIDSAVVDNADWIAMDDVPAGSVARQTPLPGTDVFDPNVIHLVMSSGGPVIAWRDVPNDLQDMIAASYETDDSEPVLVVETASGPAYKTDALLFGSCLAVDLARNTFYDQSFSGLCMVAPTATAIGWLPDGSMYVLEGLDPQPIEDVSGDVAFRNGAEGVIWGQAWSSTLTRQSPSVTADEDSVTIVGGYNQLTIQLANTPHDPAELAALFDPVDIRGSLVLNIDPQLEFGEFPDRAPLVRLRDITVVSVAGQPGLDRPSTLPEDFSFISLPSTAWTTETNNDYQYAFPTGWETTNLGFGQRLGVATSTLNAVDARCDVFPMGDLQVLSPEDVFVGVYEQDFTDFNLWLDHFDPDDVPAVSPLDSGIECLSVFDLEVRTSNRFFGDIPLTIVMALGPEAPDNRRAEAFAILDTFESAPFYGP